MVTYFTASIPMIYKHCPENQTETTCQLIEYLNSKESVYSLIPFSHQIVPKTQDWATARDAIDKMHTICAECQNKNSQKTK